mgnify:CR=1 FL=1
MPSPNHQPAADLLAFAGTHRFGTILADPPWQFQNKTGKVAPEHKRLSRYGTMKLDEIMALPAQFTKLPTPAKIVISNVAGSRIRSATIRILEVWPDAPTPYWLVPQALQCGVTNSYRNPAQLGSDRWAAVIGARHLLVSEIDRLLFARLQALNSNGAADSMKLEVCAVNATGVIMPVLYAPQ